MATNVKRLIIIGFVLFSSCHERHNISVTGKITTENGNPVPNAEVVVLCWFMRNIEEASFEKRTLTTDQSGNYKTTFLKGHQIDVAARAEGYLPARRYPELRDNELEVNLNLIQTKANPSLLMLLNTDINSSESTDRVPEIKVRIYSGADNTLDLNKIETYGFDLKTLTNKTDTTSCDFWFQIERIERQPVVIRTNSNGGIVPVYADQIESTFLFEQTSAPTTGYQQHYTLKGNEDGFFVLCRDGKTFGKIILEKSIIDRSAPDEKGGHYKEFVRQFTCLYQPNGTTDLSYSQTSLDLEDFLVDHRLQ